MTFTTICLVVIGCSAVIGLMMLGSSMVCEVTNDSIKDPEQDLSWSEDAYRDLVKLDYTKYPPIGPDYDPPTKE